MDKTSGKKHTCAWCHDDASHQLVTRAESFDSSDEPHPYACESHMKAATANQSHYVVARFVNG